MPPQNSTPDPRRLPPIDPATGLLNAYIECVRGSAVKDKFDAARGGLRFHKHMPRGIVWPFAYGFVCGTSAPDGDPADVVLLSTRAIAAGAVVGARMLGAIEAEQTIGSDSFRNDRIIAADPLCPAHAGARTLKDLDAGEVAAIERFFVEYNAAQGRGFRVLGQLGEPAARALVRPALG